MNKEKKERGYIPIFYLSPFSVSIPSDSAPVPCPTRGPRQSNIELSNLMISLSDASEDRFRGIATCWLGEGEGERQPRTRQMLHARCCCVQYCVCDLGIDVFMAGYWGFGFCERHRERCYKMAGEEEKTVKTLKYLPISPCNVFGVMMVTNLLNKNKIMVFHL